jgi:DNA transposition AAA+ family ATPase
MEMANLVDMLIGIVVAGMAWWVKTTSDEQKRIEILLNKTREDYATRLELRDTTDRLIECLHRVEDKLDRILNNA